MEIFKDKKSVGGATCVLDARSSRVSSRQSVKFRVRRNIHQLPRRSAVGDDSARTPNSFIFSFFLTLLQSLVYFKEKILFFSLGSILTVFKWHDYLMFDNVVIRVDHVRTKKCGAILCSRIMGKYSFNDTGLF